MKINAAEFRKGLVAIAGAALEAVNLGVVSGVAAHWIGVVIAVLAALGVVIVPNATAKPALEAASTLLPPVVKVPDVATAPAPEVKP